MYEIKEKMEYSKEERAVLDRAANLYNIVVDLKYPGNELYKRITPEEKFEALLEQVRKDWETYPALRNEIMHHVNQAYTKSFEIGEEGTGSLRQSGKGVRRMILAEFSDVKKLVSSSLCLRCKSSV